MEWNVQKDIVITSNPTATVVQVVLRKEIQSEEKPRKIRFAVGHSVAYYSFFYLIPVFNKFVYEIIM